MKAELWGNEMKILKNARIYTMDEERPVAGAIAFEGKEIVYVGEDRDDSGEGINLHGKTILPGMIDGHIHPGSCCSSSWHVRLPWTRDCGELLEFIKDYGRKHPVEETPFIHFEYYPTNMFDEKGPTKELLDEAISDRPVLCQDFCDHLSWLNSKALQLMGVDENTSDPSELAMFVRDKNGEPTGWVRENAWRFFEEKMYRALNWYPPEALTEKTMLPFFSFLARSGITAIFDGFIESEEQICSVCRMDKRGLLNVYYDGSVRFYTYEDLPEKIEVLRKYQQLYTTEHIKINTMKLFLDGTNEVGNAASLTGHIADPENYGEIIMNEDELTKCLLLCNQEGLDIHIHMVGDRAFRTACDAVENAQRITAKKEKKWTCRPVFAHCELVDAADMKRPAELGIYINWSCHWSGGYFGDKAVEYYGEEKWRGMYQFNTMIASGANVSFSSDVVTGYELHRAYPFFGMEVAATRVDLEFPLDPSKYPGSMRPEASARLDPHTLLRGYTVNAAKQLRWNDRMGILKEGKLANFIVVDADPLKIPPEQLHEIKVEAVVFEGRLISGKLQTGEK